MAQTNQEAGSTKEEQIGFHKGALSTLAKEREEMKRILQIVEQLMQLHIKALKELGVDLEAAAKEVQQKPSEKKKKPIEDILK
jgi:thiaminase